MPSRNQYRMDKATASQGTTTDLIVKESPRHASHSVIKELRPRKIRSSYLSNLDWMSDSSIFRISNRCSGVMGFPRWLLVSGKAAPVPFTAYSLYCPSQVYVQNAGFVKGAPALKRAFSTTVMISSCRLRFRVGVGSPDYPLYTL